MRPIAEVRFTPVRLRQGYSMPDVDAFLDKIPTVRLEDRVQAVRDARFTTVFWSEGYDMHEVDDYLDEMVEHYQAEAQRAQVSQNFASDAAALASDAQALRNDWNAAGFGSWTSTITTEPFTAVSGQALTHWRKLAQDTLAVAPTAKEKELATALLAMVDSYEALTNAVNELEGVNIATVES